MVLKILGSNSLGNCYILENEKEALIIEAGVKLIKVKEALNYNIRKIAGCLISHEHNDHAKSYNDFLAMGITVLSPDTVYKSKGYTSVPPFAKIVEPGQGYRVGGFRIIPFDVQHDVPAFGYQIDHEDSGRIIFLTDTFMCEYTFDDVSHWLIEANYADDILDERIATGKVPPSMRPRLLKSHMEIETTKGILASNDLSDTRNIVLIHLSDGSSDEERFIREITGLTGKPVYAANNGQVINFSKSPY